MYGLIALPWYLHSLQWRTKSLGSLDRIVPDIASSYHSLESSMSWFGFDTTRAPAIPYPPRTLRTWLVETERMMKYFPGLRADAPPLEAIVDAIQHFPVLCSSHKLRCVTSQLRARHHWPQWDRNQCARFSVKQACAPTRPQHSWDYSLSDTNVAANMSQYL